jgi:hypothetical protein
MRVFQATQYCRLLEYEQHLTPLNANTRAAQFCGLVHTGLALTTRSQCLHMHTINPVLIAAATVVTFYICADHQEDINSS